MRVLSVLVAVGTALKLQLMDPVARAVALLEEFAPNATVANATKTNPTTLDVIKPSVTTNAEAAKVTKPVVANAEVATAHHTMTAEEKIAALEAQVAHLEDNQKQLKVQHKRSQESHNKLVKNSRLSAVDQQMEEKFDQWDQHSYEKTRVGGTMVISKLKNAIHFLKKGDEQGLLNVIEGMKDLTR
mmetsp:Transcript_23325/g.51301  ORF Transcript_23325/g.51301 Transcript_23325/m.51301 type:complete len:186 (+) Transcript_23325:63-620(+)|eukprot:CAMPEP_0204273892 /NCGR_PEP_ID=MMETSP0468-20130131/24584_1 /ASSEMBLY_ACC=CAM_ASM_000383 /TAXON_ID=2969 /ORGANISM="Oxyrrhis marina" /LENGTH=185 /DNA_ID=CAMNT_0051250017 /DNA_START=55 /DNA_END=612 /DNA_ORIENTATION=+